MKRKVTVTTGTRAEYGILRPVLTEINSSKKLDLYLIVAGMHLSKKHGLTIREITNNGFKIHAKVKMMPGGDSNFFMSSALGEGIIVFSKIFNNLKPDINLILGDRDEAFASALAASHMNIPNAHIHGGDKTQAGIDEYIRHAITKISNIHFAATKKSRERIIKMGENPKFVFLTGSPSIDEIRNNKITQKMELKSKYRINLGGNEILLVQHPVTTQTNLSELQIKNTLKAINELAYPTIAIAPNSDAGNKAIFNNYKLFSKQHNFFHMFRNLPRSDYLGMLKNCGVLVGNSSSGIVEASYFDTPVVNIGIRQKDREKGASVIDVISGSSSEIYKAIIKALETKKIGKIKNPKIYGYGKASKKIVKKLEEIKIGPELINKQICL